MGTNPSIFPDCGRCPVDFVSRDEVQKFIGKLNALAGGNQNRLPAEAEWEYAAQAGTRGDRYSTNLDAIAWCDRGLGSGSRSEPVGRKSPNAWGLHDMLGNVAEWVQAWHGRYPRSLVTDPQGPTHGHRTSDSGRQLA